MANSTRIIMWILLIAAVGAGALWILGGKQAEYSTGLGIAAPPDSIFPFLTEPERLKSWHSGLTEVAPMVSSDNREPQTPPKLTSRVITDENGKQVRYQDEVIRFERNVSLSVQSSNPKSVITSIFQLEPREGETFIVYRVKSTYRGLGRFLAPLAGDSTQSRIENDIRKLKSLIESTNPNSINSIAPAQNNPIQNNPAPPIQNADGAATGVGPGAVRTAESPVSGQPFSFDPN